MPGDPGEPIVLVHGFSATPAIWSPIFARLEATHPTLVVTLDGHVGGRPIEPRNVSVAALADGVERDMDTAGFARAHIVGNSLGGWLALELARRGRASSTVPIAPGGSWEPYSSADRELQAHLARNGRAARKWLPLLKPAVRSARLRRAIFGQMVAHGERIPTGIAVEMLEASARCPIHAELREAMFAPGGGLEVKGIDSPVLLVWGSDDRLTPKEIYGQRIRARLPRAEWRELPDTGHIPMFDAPSALADLILAFIALSAQRSAGGRPTT
jgi:pimeloyl-ACP methyl ester carboxylesterase